MFEFNAGKLIKFIEKTLLAIIAVLTIVATLQEILKIYEIGEVNLADLLLLFIYTEVLGMIGVFYTSNRIPITLPLFIAMTAISMMRLVLELKKLSLFYEITAFLCKNFVVWGVWDYKRLKSVNNSIQFIQRCT